MTSKEVHDMIHQEIPLKPVQSNVFGEVPKRYRYRGTDVEGGFISSISGAFCSDCTRMRLSADGKKYTCLFASNGVDLLVKMRKGASGEEILDEITRVWQARDDRYSEEKGRISALSANRRVEMSYIGG